MKIDEKNIKSFVRPRHFNTTQQSGKLMIKSGPKQNLDEAHVIDCRRFVTQLHRIANTVWRTNAPKL